MVIVEDFKTIEDRLEIGIERFIFDSSKKEVKNIEEAIDMIVIIFRYFVLVNFDFINFFRFILKISIYRNYKVDFDRNFLRNIESIEEEF